MKFEKHIVFAALSLLVSYMTLLSAQSSGLVARGCNGEADVIFLIDVSAGVTDQQFSNAKDFVRELVSKLDISFNLTHVALATTEVGNYARIQLVNFYDKGLLLNAIDQSNRTLGTSTSIPSALRFIRNVMLSLQNGGRNSIPDVIFIIAPDSIITEYDIPNSELKNEIRVTQQSNIFVGMVLYGDQYSIQEKRNRANGLVTAPYDQNLILVSDSGSLMLPDIVSFTQQRLCLEIPACAGLADIAFVLDRTGSIGIDNWEVELEFVTRVVENLYISDEGIRIAVVVYGQEASIIFPLNRYRSKIAILEAISNIIYDEATATRTDLALALTQDSVFGASNGLGNRISVKDITIVVTDGSSSLRDRTAAEAKNSRDRGNRLLAIGVENTHDENFEQELLNIASFPKSDNVFQVSSFNNLEQIEDTLVLRTCREAPPNCTKEVDVVFAIDASGSIIREDFLRVVNFVRDLVTRLGVESGLARVGVVAFSNTPVPQFFLNTYSTVAEITRAISNINYIQGATMTADALDFVGNVMFTAVNGDRPNVDNILLVITDGESNNGTATVEAARRIRENGVSVLSLGVGAWAIPYELEGMASHPKVRNMFHVDDYETLFTATDLLVATVCDVIDDCISNPCQNAGTCVDSMNQYYCKCARGYTGRDCDKSCEHKADIFFLIDSSGSIGRENFLIMQQFIQDIIHGVDVDGGARIGIITFATDARVEFLLNEHNTTQSVLNAMNLRYTGGTTNTADALRLVRDVGFIESNGNRPDVIDIVILLTDGKSDNRERTLQEAVEVRKAGIHISVIGVGSNIRPSELRGIATDPDEKNVYTVKDFNALTGIIQTLLTDVCNENNECDPNPCLNGATCRDGIATYTCRCASGFTGLNCDRACDDNLDVCLVIDVSGSIQRENFDFAIDFMKLMVDQWDIDSGAVRVCLITYNDTAILRFGLNTFTSKEDMKLVMDNLRFYGGLTNTAGALNLLSTQAFREVNGDRRLAFNYVVLITDGNPNINVDQTVPNAINIKIEGAHLILATIGSGLTTGRQSVLLQSIPSSPVASNFFNVPKYSELGRIVPDIANAMCNDVNECASSPCQNGGLCTDRIQNYLCDCTDEFTGQNCERQCFDSNDICLIVDVSGSIEENNAFDLQLNLLKELILGLDYKRDKTRVAFITFAGEVNVRFYLNRYTSSLTQQRDLLNAIVIDSVGRETNIAAAIREGYNEVFQPNRGDRQGQKNTIILLSDGKNTLVRDRETINEADEAKRRDINIHTVSVGTNPHRDLMNKVANNPPSLYSHQLPDNSNIPEVVNRILSQLCI